MQLLLTLHTTLLSKYGHFWLPLQKAGSDIKLKSMLQGCFSQCSGWCHRSYVSLLYNACGYSSTFCYHTPGRGWQPCRLLEKVRHFSSIKSRRSNRSPPPPLPAPVNPSITDHCCCFLERYQLLPLFHLSHVCFSLLTKTIIKALHNRHLSFKSVYLTNETANVTHSMSK